MRVQCLSALLLVEMAFGQDYSAPKMPAVNSVPAAKSSARCPWLTEGSAASALGGEVTVAVSIASPSQGSCSFVHQSAPAGQLTVLVGPGSIPACPQGSEKVIGIGTRASRCRVSISGVEATEMISGAVRETSVAVILGRGKRIPPGKRDFLEELAEQVAGNLF